VDESMKGRACLDGKSLGVMSCHARVRSLRAVGFAVAHNVWTLWEMA